MPQIATSRCQSTEERAKREHEAHRAGTDFSQQLLEAGAMHGTRARAPLVLVNRVNRLWGPAQGHRTLHQGIWSLDTFVVAADLVGGRLADRHQRLPPQMVRSNFGRHGLRVHTATLEAWRPRRTRMIMWEHWVPKACLVSSENKPHAWCIATSSSVGLGSNGEDGGLACHANRAPSRGARRAGVLVRASA